MADGKYEGVIAFASVLAGLGGLAALITVALNFWLEKPASGPSEPTITTDTATNENPIDSKMQIGVTDNPAGTPDMIGRDQFFGTWTGAYGLESYTITFYEDGTYRQRTENRLLGNIVRTSGIWTFNAPHFSMEVSDSSSQLLKPLGSTTYGEVLELSQSSFVVKTQLIPNLTMVRQ